ncbi:MAG TPA: glycosyltransferase family 2 protein [Planktothrix sp.]
MPNNLVSIVIAYYQTPDVLLKAVESALEQTYDEVEVIVVDDCSKKGPAADVCAKFDSVGKLRMIRHERNLGLAFSRNTGVSNAKGHLIVPLDGDDYLDKTYVEKVIAALTEDAVGVCSDVQIFGNLNMIWKTTPDVLHVMCAMSSPSTFLYRKRAYDAVGGYTTAPVDAKPGTDPLADLQRRLKHPDTEFWIKLLERGWKINKVDEPLYFYRKSETSMSSDNRTTEIAVLAGLHPELYTKHLTAILQMEEEKYWQAKDEWQELRKSYDNLLHYYTELKDDYAKLSQTHHDLTNSRSWGVAQQLMKTSSTFKRVLKRDD